MVSKRIPTVFLIVVLVFLAVAQASPTTTDSEAKVRRDVMAFQRFIEEEAAWKEAACRRQMERSATERQISE